MLRQPKRKETILNGVWGRLAYGGEIGRPQDGMFSGPAVFLEATPPDLRFSMNVLMGPATRSEFERLCRDGHSVTRKGSRFVFNCSLQTIRNTQLYRTVIHEIGHWVDWLNRVKRPPPPEAQLADYEWRWELLCLSTRFGPL